MRRSLAIAWALCLIFATTTAAQPARPPKVWAVVIGIDAYDDSSIPACRGASTDARALRKWLIETAGWAPSQVLLMDGASQRRHGSKEQQLDSLRPSRENLDWAIKEWLAFRVQPGDVVLVSFGGQAIGGREGDSRSRDQLLPIDAKAATLDATGWPIQDALDGLASKGENPILVWLDTSLSGRGRPAGDSLGRRTSAMPFLLEVTRWPGVSAWISADGGIASEPAKGTERGAFLSVILPAMGTVDRPGNILGSLFAATRDPRLQAQNFRTAGGLGPEWSLWPKALAAIVRPREELLLQHGHSDRVTAVLFSVDGSTMFTASRDSTIKVWRMRDRMLLRTLSAHSVGVTSMDLSPDGSKLVSGDGAGRIILWDLPSLRPTRYIGRPPHERGIAKLVYRGDGSAFASLDEGGRVVAWTVDGNGLTPKRLAENVTAVTAGESRIAVSLREKDEGPAIRIFEENGEERLVLGPGGLILMESLAIRGDWLAAGNKSGTFGIWNLSNGNILARVQAKTPIEALRISSAAAFGVSGNSIQLVSLDPGVPPRTLEGSDEIANAIATDDGRVVAAWTKRGEIVAWDLRDPSTPTRVTLETIKDQQPSTVLAVSTQGELVSGDQDGGIRFWEWPSGKFLTMVRPHRGKIETLAISPDGRHLAQIDHDRRARLWDLREGRDLLSIPGLWNSLAFLPDGRSLAMTRRDGKIEIVDRVTAETRKVRFDPPSRDGGENSSWGFDPIVVSPDGAFVAAGSSQGPLAAVWAISGGPTVMTIRNHEDPISAVHFSADSQHILTASLDGTVKVHAIRGEKPLWTLSPEPIEGDDAGVTAAVFAATKLRRVATGHIDGRVFLWEIEDGRGKKHLLGRFEGPVRDLAVTPDGTRLIACGEDKTVRMWRIDGALPPDEPRRFLPQHTEQVNALAVWPDGRLIASASDDSTIRLWRSDGSGQLGTLCVSPQDGHWVAFTPEGQFDSAPGGETQVTFVEGSRVLTLDQADEESRIFGLSCRWLDHEAVPGRSSLLVSRPPPLLLSPKSTVKGGEVEMSVKIAEADLVNFRLYVNDKPVRDETDFKATEDPTIKVVSVQLAQGENRIVAMASRPVAGAVLGRSNEVRLTGRKDEPQASGVVHSVALGISKYRLNALKFADHDASDFASFLAKHGVAGGGRQGMKLVLQNHEVTPRAVEQALLTLREQVRPEDTVVVFLAGHTDVRRDRFCLLLPEFPFNLEPRGQVGAEDSGARKASIVDDPETLIPYSTIYRNLARMNALNRLVVIDACQADAVYDDPGVRRIQDKVDDGAHRARTSYLLATRRGEAAESTVLEHGLITHLLLRGMGSSDVKAEPGGQLGNADADDNGVVTTQELRQFLDTHLPVLMTQVDLSGLRANPNSPPKTIEQKARAQTSTATFPLVKLPK